MTSLSDKPALKKRRGGYAIILPCGDEMAWSTFRRSPGPFAGFVDELNMEVDEMKKNRRQPEVSSSSLIA